MTTGEGIPDKGNESALIILFILDLNVKQTYHWQRSLTTEAN